MVQTVITLPLFLFVIFFIIFVGVTYNARSGLIEATRHGARLAISRGDNTIGGLNNIISELDSYSGGTPPLPLNRGTGLANVDIDYDNWKQFFEPTARPFYDSSGGNLNQLRDYYAIAYIYRSMREVVRDDIIFPCDCPIAGDCTNSGTLHGCVTCVNPYPASDSKQGIKCIYRPHSAILSPVLGMLKILTGSNFANIEVDSEFFYPATLSCDPSLGPCT